MPISPNRVDHPPVVPAVSPLSLLSWHAAALALLVILPAQWRLGRPFWQAPQELLVQLIVWGLLYLALVLVVQVQGHRTRLGRTVLAGVTAPMLWAAGHAVLTLLVAIPVARAVAVGTLGLGAALAVAPLWLGRKLLLGSVAMALAAGAALAIGKNSATLPLVESLSIRTALYPVTVTTFRSVLGTGGVEGGALVALDDGFLHVNGAGEFNRLSWDSVTSGFRARPVPLAPPLNIQEYRAAHPGVTPLLPPLRVTGLLLGPPGADREVLAAHLFWHGEARCLTLRVSRARLPGDGATARGNGGWQPLFDTAPCFSLGQTAHFNQTGGQMAWLGPDSLLLTVGDQGFEGLNAPAWAQDSTTDYGKVLLLVTGQPARHWTMGHRNMQGIVVARDGRVWMSEHGPQGGDELNLLVPGGNYGWPLVTYGNNYGSESWPLNGGRRNHESFREPIHAFVPSPALTAMVQVGERSFPDWTGDLLIGSLQAGTLFRARTRQDRLTYLEPIPIRHRIRSLAEGTDGRVLLWTDGGNLVLVAPAGGLERGAVAYGRCSGCHGPALEGSPTGPPLAGVVGRRVAGRPGYAYSAALAQLGGFWTPERLDAFLGDPQGLVPGTAMVLDPVTDPAERQALIQYLRRH